MKQKGFILIEILAILVILLIVGFLGYSIYEEIDFGAKTGIIVDKKYHASWVGFQTSCVNNVTINIPVIHPQSWSIKIQKNNKELWIDVSESEYNSLNVGDCYNCKGE